MSVTAVKKRKQREKGVSFQWGPQHGLTCLIIKGFWSVSEFRRGRSLLGCALRSGEPRGGPCLRLSWAASTSPPSQGGGASSTSQNGASGL